MGKRSSTRRWLQQKSSDPFVKRRDNEGYRTRAVFKLKDIAEKESLLKPGQTVLDLGAAPGGWSAFAEQRVGAQGCVVSVDILAMDVPAGVNFIQGDCRDTSVVERIQAIVGGKGVDLVLSDIAPNITGIRDADEANFLDIAESVIETSDIVLKPGGALVMKLFQFPATDMFAKDLKARFERVVRRKPEASRKQSKEFYVVALGFKPHTD